MNIFEQVSVPRRGRSKFNLSHSTITTLDMGQLIPIAVHEAVPGDLWQIQNELVIRMMPMVAPVLHEIDATIHWFAVPYRLLWASWPDYITGGVTGGDVSVLPRWTPTGGGVTNDNGYVTTDNGVGSLWDYLGFPIDVVPTGCLPMDFPKRAYNLIWNEYYRDETADAALNIETSVKVMNRRWRKDYFTSALPWQQRGTAPSVPLSGTGSAVWNDLKFIGAVPPVPINAQFNDQAGGPSLYVNGTNARVNARDFFNSNTFNLSGVGTFTINDLRTIVAVQRWMELNARGGVRYTEWLQAHYDCAPRDERLQRPEYIGGFKAPVIVSEVLQTSKTEVGAPQGNLAGHGITADRQFCGTYRVQEFCVLMGILSVMPRAMYDQGVDRQWLRESRYDFFDPLFVGLSEQAIARGELYATNVEAENETIFGYQGRYDEMRVKQSRVTGKMHTTFDYWHISYQFGSAPALNSAFLKCVPRKDFLAAPTEITMVAHVGNQLFATRSLPAHAEPGEVGEG